VELRFSISGSVNRLGVEAKGDVVDKYSAVYLREIYAALAAVGERLEGADDVVPVDAEI
jgi:hypothetical protein